MTLEMQFLYQIRTEDGKRQTGTIEAGDIERAIDILHRHKLYIVSITPVKPSFLGASRLRIFKKANVKEVAVFFRQLATLAEAKVPLVEGLRILVKQQTNRFLKDTLFQIASDVEGGTSFSEALERHSKVFSPFYISIIKSGEASGRIQESLIYLADHLERQYDFNNKVKGAMMYPALIIIGFGTVAFIMMTFILPKLLAVFKESGQELPLPTKLLISLSNIFQNYWYFIIIGIIGIVLGIKYISTIPEGKAKLDLLKLKLPLIGKLFKKIYLARFAENLSTLIESGLPITKALKISGNVVGNEIYKRIIFESAKKVRVGEPIAFVFERSKEIPLMVSQMIGVGERSGKLDLALKNIARFYTKEVNNSIDNLMVLIEPILILILGAGVAVLVAAILMPIYNLAGAF